MPLLMCPNDNSNMQTMNRGGVEFDMCPTCRGVWLDRGELEKLMSSAQAEMEAPPRAEPPRGPAPGYAQPPGYGQPGYGGERGYGEGGGEWGERGERGYGHGGYRKKKRGLDIFDIFD
jgi:uncharacterized protein